MRQKQSFSRFVFDIKCTLKVLDYDAGIWDCCALAVSSAITNFRRRDVTYNPTTKKLILASFFNHSIFYDEHHKLSIRRTDPQFH
jgi:exosome complex RNA-binding protein Rrp42 (RNase PH superfamily)